MASPRPEASPRPCDDGGEEGGELTPHGGGGEAGGKPKLSNGDAVARGELLPSTGARGVPKPGWFKLACPP